MLAFNIGQVGEPASGINAMDMKPMDIFTWGAVAQVDYGLLSDQLRIGDTLRIPPLRGS